MSHRHRFFGTPEDGQNRVVLRDQEAHHALHVVRLRAGDTVAVFDGQCREWTCSVAALNRKEAVLEVESLRETPPPPHRLVLAQAWIQREKALEEMIQRGTEVGVAAFVFFRADRSERAPKASDKWTRWAIESCKQCGRLWLPAFSVADSLGAALDQCPPLRLMAALGRPVEPLRAALTATEAALIVGPEGDFSETEVAAAEAAGVRFIGLGESVFRAEVAAIVGSSLVLYEWGALGPVAAR